MIEGHSVFHESYYDHSCLVFSETDVLFTDIKGQHWLASLRRWWHNLFLLWYDDERCRIYYSSSQAMRMERSRQFRRFRRRIHPLSKFSNLWNYFISVTIIVRTIIFTHVTIIFFRNVCAIHYLFGMFLDFILIIDIAIIFQTGYIDKESRKIILDAHMGYLHFASTHFFFYVASSIPVHTLLFIKYGWRVSCVLCKANLFVCVLKLLDTFSVYRIIVVSSRWTIDRDSFKKTYAWKFLRIFILGLMFMMIYHNVVATVSLIDIIKTNHIDENSLFTMQIKMSYWREPPTNLQYLTMELSKIIKSLLLFSNGLQPKLVYMDIIFGLIGYIMANYFMTWFLMDCFAVVSRLKYSPDQMEIHKNRTKNMLRSRQLSDKIYFKVMDYYKFNMSKSVVIEKTNDLYQFLPISIIRELKQTCYARYVRNIPYFQDWQPKVIVDIANLLKEEIFLENDIVSDAWSEGEGLIIVETGVLAVYTYNQEETGHLIDGDFFGELSLVTDKEIRTSMVIATLPCKVLVLPKNDFRKYMRQHPKLFFTMRSQLRQMFADDDTPGPSTLDSEMADTGISLAVSNPDLASIAASDKTNMSTRR